MMFSQPELLLFAILLILTGLLLLRQEAERERRARTLVRAKTVEGGWNNATYLWSRRMRW